MSLAVWSRMPDPMPIHFGPGGQPDDYGSRALGLLITPMIVLALPLLLLLITKLDPRRDHVERSLGAIGAIVVGCGVFLLAAHVLVIHAALHETTFNEQLLFSLLGILFVLIGLVLPKLRSNWFAGIRTPWTLSSERVWHLTHRVGGWAFTVAGLVVVAGAWLVKGMGLFVLLMSAAGVAALVSFIYSYFCYRREEGRADAPTRHGVS